MPRKKKEHIGYVRCSVTMESQDNEGHTHDCIGEDEHDGDHYCTSCMRWWGKKKP